MEKSFSLGIVIGATLSNTFNTVFSSIENKFQSLEKSSQHIKLTKAYANKLRAYEKSIENLKKQRETLLELGKATDHVDRRIQIFSEKVRELKLEAIKAGISIKELRQDFKKLGDAVSEANKKLKIGKLQTDLASLRGKFTGIIGGALSLSAVVRPAIDFESAFADVQKVVDFSSKEQEAQLRKQILDMSTKIPLSAGELAQITAQGGQLGIKAPDLPKFTELVAKMSVAFDMIPERAGEAFAKLKNVYNLSMDEVKQLGDAINYLGNNTAAKEKDIIETLGRIGGIAKDFGLAKEGAAALADAFIALGKPPEVAATAINALLGKLNTIDTQSPAFKRAFSQVMPIEEFKRLKEQDPETALLAFLDALKQLNKEARANIISQLFGQEYSDDISLLVGSLGEYIKAIDLVSKKEKYKNAVDKEFQKRVQTTAEQLKLLSNRIERMAITLGSVLLPPLNTIIGAFSKGLDAVTGFLEKHETLAKVIAFGAAGLLGFATISLGATIAIKSLQMASLVLSGSFGNLFKMFSLVSKASSILGTTIGFIATKGFPVLKVSTILYIKTLWGLTTGIFNVSKAFIGKLIPALFKSSTAFSVVSKAFMFLSRLFMLNPVGFVIGGLALGAFLVIKNWEKVKSFFKGLWDFIKEGFSLLGKAIAKIFEFSPIGLMFKGAKWLAGKIFGKEEHTERTTEKKEEQSLFSKVISFFSGEKKTETAQSKKEVSQEVVQKSIDKIEKAKEKGLEILNISQKKQEEESIFEKIFSFFKGEEKSSEKKQLAEEITEKSVVSKSLEEAREKGLEILRFSQEQEKEKVSLSEKQTEKEYSHKKFLSESKTEQAVEKIETSKEQEKSISSILLKAETVKLLSIERSSNYSKIENVFGHISKLSVFSSIFDITKSSFSFLEEKISSFLQEKEKNFEEKTSQEKKILDKESISKIRHYERQLYFKADINIHLTGKVENLENEVEQKLEQNLKEKFEKWFYEAMRTMQERQYRRAF